jgi:hypothetical protein
MLRRRETSEERRDRLTERGAIRAEYEGFRRAAKDLQQLSLHIRRSLAAVPDRRRRLALRHQYLPYEQRLRRSVDYWRGIAGDPLLYVFSRPWAMQSLINELHGAIALAAEVADAMDDDATPEREP